MPGFSISHPGPGDLGPFHILPTVHFVTHLFFSVSLNLHFYSPFPCANVAGKKKKVHLLGSVFIHFFPHRVSSPALYVTNEWSTHAGNPAAVKHNDPILPPSGWRIANGRWGNRPNAESWIAVVFTGENDANFQRNGTCGTRCGGDVSNRPGRCGTAPISQNELMNSFKMWQHESHAQILVLKLPQQPPSHLKRQQEKTIWKTWTLMPRHHVMKCKLHKALSPLPALLTSDQRDIGWDGYNS